METLQIDKKHIENLKYKQLLDEKMYEQKELLIVFEQSHFFKDFK